MVLTFLALAVCLLAIAAVGTLAYFTDKTDTKDNTFTVGNVDIELTEDKWVEPETVEPGLTYDKNPTVTNIGENDAYIRVDVTVSDWAAFTAAAAAHGIADLTTIFGGYVDADWTRKDISVDTATNTAKYVDQNNKPIYADKVVNDNKFSVVTETYVPIENYTARQYQITQELQRNGENVMNRNYYGFNAEKKQPSKRLVGLVALVLILICTIVGTVAFLATHTSEVKNTFTPSEVSCKVEETVSGGVKSSVMVQNTGNIPAYIRVAVVANKVDSEGNITGAADVSSALAGSGWEKDGDYYYYNKPVEPKDYTGELLKEGGINLKDIQVTILASAIQSTPADAAQNAWGYVPGTN